MEREMCPAEIYMERPHSTNGYRWVWEICQPDANWGVWREGYAYNREKCVEAAQHALWAVHREQGYR